MFFCSTQEQAAERGIHSIYFVVSPNGQQLVEIASLADQGQLKPAIDQVYSLAQARQAFERSLSAHPAGKIVLQIAEK
ncbi:MAG: zinc-binding dehydrogenase [Anaerolineaceae bacterium]|nr:zinc-binding dehydrogenase [Anaerolineaceae bacterium]